MQGSPFGKWIIGHRYQAQLIIPGLIGIVLIVLYFFGNLFVQSMVAPGFWEPRLLGTKVSLPDILKAYMLLWIFILAWRTLVVTPDYEVRILCILVGIGTIASFLTWMDGNTLVNRLWEGAMDTEAGAVKTFLSGGWFTLEFAVVSVLTLLFFVYVPLMHRGSKRPVIAIMAPSRWMIATVALMYLIFRFAHALQAQGFGAVKGVEGVLGADMSLFMVVIFQYMVLLHMAELNYHSVVRREAPNQTWRLRH